MKTVIFSHVMTDIVYAVVIAILWHRYKDRFPGLSLWLVSYMFEICPDCMKKLYPDFIYLI